MSNADGPEYEQLSDQSILNLYPYQKNVGGEKYDNDIAYVKVQEVQCPISNTKSIIGDLLGVAQVRHKSKIMGLTMSIKFTIQS